jgi:hypothetical protein
MHAARLLSFVTGASFVAATLLPATDARAEATPTALKGLAVVAEGDSASAAASLARGVYADPSLLPPTLDEGRARALAGGPVGPDSPRELQDLAATRAALRGDDAPSRNMLASITASLHLKGVVVVEANPGDKPTARVFVASSGSFDAVVYEADPAPPVTWGSGGAAWVWSGAVSALHRGFAEPTASGVVAPAPIAALAPTPAAVAADKTTGSSKPFYASPWFWGAIGAAAFAGAAFFFATRDSADPNIQLQVQVPR